MSRTTYGPYLSHGRTFKIVLNSPASDIYRPRWDVMEYKLSPHYNFWGLKSSFPSRQWVLVETSSEFSEAERYVEQPLSSPAVNSPTSDGTNQEPNHG